MYEPRYARLVDAFEDTDIETDEGDIDDNLDNVGDEDEINALIETNPNCEKRFILLLIPHNGWQKSFSGAKIQLLSPVAVCPALSGVWSWLAACGSAGVLHAVRAVIMCGLYSARRGEGEVVVSQPGKRVIYK